MKRISLYLIFFTLAPATAFPCGGLFCNANEPVNQAAEQILFARTATGLEMNVRITYQGPSTEFGWLLPVPRDVTYELGSDALFTTLSEAANMRFEIETVYAGDCQDLGRWRGRGRGLIAGSSRAL